MLPFRRWGAHRMKCSPQTPPHWLPAHHGTIHWAPAGSTEQRSQELELYSNEMSRTSSGTGCESPALRVPEMVTSKLREAIVLA